MCPKLLKKFCRNHRARVLECRYFFVLFISTHLVTTRPEPIRRTSCDQLMPAHLFSAKKSMFAFTSLTPGQERKRFLILNTRTRRSYGILLPLLRLGKAQIHFHAACAEPGPVQTKFCTHTRCAQAERFSTDTSVSHNSSPGTSVYPTRI